MNLRRKILWICLLAVVMTALTACNYEATPYERNDSENYTVSVKFDANGGAFTTNAPVIVDSFNIENLPVNSDGKVELPLIAPNDARRDKDAFTPVKNGYFLAGWYAQCTQPAEQDGQILYAEPWNFENDRLSVDPSALHTSSEPVLTLYAAWAPLYQLEVYDLSSGELCGSFSFDPTQGTELKMPAWDEESGTIEMYKFPKWQGHTFMNAYYDADGTQPVDTETVLHPGTIRQEDGTVENSTLKLYADWREGEWYRISTAEQFADNFSLNGCYDICADLDFSDEIWPTAMMYGSFSGKIVGNGYTIANVSIVQTDNAKQNAGLFGQLTESSAISDITFENITFTVKKGARMMGTSYGLLAGTIADRAVMENVAITNSVLQIDSGCYFATDDYSIGLVCGLGTSPVDASGIRCEAVGENPENVSISVLDAVVTVAFATE